MTTKIYVSIDKETREVIHGLSGQYAYGSPGVLKQSMTQKLKWDAKRKGVKTKELYDIVEVNMGELVHSLDMLNLVGREENGHSRLVVH